MRAGLTSALALLLTALPAAADPISLSDAVRLALDVSPDLEGAEAGVDAAGAGLQQARGQRGISVGAMAQAGVSETDFTTASVSQTPRQVALQAELPLYASGSLASAERAARFSLRSAERMKLGTEEVVALETLEAYTGVWLADQSVAISREEVESLRLRGEETDNQLQQGLATRTDMSFATARLASAKARMAGEEARLAGAQLRLERLTGLPGAEPIDPTAIRLELPASLDDAIAMALSGNAQLAAARAEADSARAQESRTRGEFGPKVSLKARASAGEDVYFFFEDQITDIGAFVTVEIPLFTNGVRPAAIDQASAGRRAAEAAERKVEQALRENAGALWYLASAQEQALSAAREAEHAAGLAVEGTRREYALGLRTLVDVLDAENEFSRTAIARRSSEVDLLIAQARLLALVSELRAQVLSIG